jgi:hypothetical protein
VSFSFPIPHLPLRLSFSLILSTLPSLWVFFVGFSSFSFRLAPAEEAAGIVPLSSQFQRNSSSYRRVCHVANLGPAPEKISLFPIFFFLQLCKKFLINYLHNPARDFQLGNKIKPKCVNCDGDDTANNAIFPEYQKKLEAAQERRNRSNTTSEKFVPAALPKVNVWEIRKNIERNGSSSSVRGSTQATPSTSNTKAHSNTEAIPSSPNSQGSPSDLFAQIKTLNSLCNVSNLITALRDLNNLLSNAKSSEERFMTVLQFTQNITKSPISSQGDK